MLTTHSRPGADRELGRLDGRLRRPGPGLSHGGASALRSLQPCSCLRAGAGWNSCLLSAQPGLFQRWVPGPLGGEGTGQPAGTWSGCLRNRTPGWGQSSTHGGAGNELTALKSTLQGPWAELRYKRAMSGSGTCLRLHALGCQLVSLYSQGTADMVLVHHVLLHLP